MRLVSEEKRKKVRKKKKERKKDTKISKEVKRKDTGCMPQELQGTEK